MIVEIPDVWRSRQVATAYFDLEPPAVELSG
jgi:hypothetical protein